MKDQVRIGNGCGFWGDNLDAPIYLAERGQLDYLTLEYLAELTMSILALQKQRDPTTGYASDFLDVLTRLAPLLAQRPNLKIITNAGGMNAFGCAAKACTILERNGLKGVRVAAVVGDDLFPNLGHLLSRGESFANLDTNEEFNTVRERLVSANAYLGAPPIVEALREGARIVITGRVADASLTVAPAIFEFGWRWDDWDLLAGATVAGHLIECGAQATGGLWCDYQSVDLAEVGYPIATIDRHGAFRLTKTPDSGGAVNRETVLEQLFYEIGDPAAYLTPDVVADFSQLDVLETAKNEVAVSGARGKPATSTFKASMAYRDGFTASGSLTLVGPGALAKARACGEMIRRRLTRAGALPEHFLVECLGAGEAVPGCLPACEPPEVVCRVSGRDQKRVVIDRFTKEFAPLVTSGPPGVTGYATGRPPVREVFAFWPALVRKELLSSSVHMMES
jgi:Acyclic terpene utilisation family protein AtuA